MRLLLILMVFSACIPAITCPESIVCETAKQDEQELQKRLSWQAGQLANLTKTAMLVEGEKFKCPIPNCHCTPPKKRRAHKIWKNLHASVQNF